MLAGSLGGLFGTTLLLKRLLLAAALIFLCAAAPLTPNMIVESGGELTWYFIAMSLLWILVGGILAALFISTENELTTREAGTDSYELKDRYRAPDHRV